MNAPSEPKPALTRGIDHLAFVTDDLPATMDFYTRVLGMQLVHVRRVPFERDRGQPPYDNLRHYFFNMGNDTLLAFFYDPNGIRLELATDRSGEDRGVVESVLQTGEEARAELETLYSDPRGV